MNLRFEMPVRPAAMLGARARRALMLVVSLAGWALAGCTGWPPHPATGPIIDNRYFSWDLSPDGHTIVWSEIVGGATRHLFVRDLNTMKLTRLAPTAFYECFPSFSADGKWITYQGKASMKGAGHIYIRSVDGKTDTKHVRRVTADERASDECPAFSHDGKRLVFGRSTEQYYEKTSENVWGGRDLWVVNIDGTGLVRLTHTDECALYVAHFVNDDRDVIFNEVADDPAGGHFRVSLVASDGTGRVRPVVEKQFSCYDISPLPDGKRFIFTYNESGNADSPLFIGSLDGSPPRLVRANPPLYGNAAKVSPDGQKLYFILACLWEAGIDGSNAHPIGQQDVTDSKYDPKPDRPANAGRP